VSWLFDPEFRPRLKPREYVLIRGEYYEVVETRPMLPFDYKLTGIAEETSVDLREAGLRGLENEVLNYRLRVLGPVRLVVRVEGAGGPVYGGWGAAERVVDETVPEYMLEFVQLADKAGYPVVRVKPLVTPAWLRLRAYGWVYVVRRAERAPATYAVPPYIAYPPTGVRS
jgi:hypothetical protein